MQNIVDKPHIQHAIGFIKDQNFQQIKEQLQSAGLEPDNAEIAMIPATTVPLDIDSAQSALGLIDMLEDLDDVQNVYTNADIPDEAYEAES